MLLFYTNIQNMNKKIFIYFGGTLALLCIWALLALPCVKNVSVYIDIYIFHFYSLIHHLFSDKTLRIFYKRNSLQQCYYFAILLCEIFNISTSAFNFMPGTVFMVVCGRVLRLR